MEIQRTTFILSKLRQTYRRRFGARGIQDVVEIGREKQLKVRFNSALQKTLLAQGEDAPQKKSRAALQRWI
jgi:hypothetical protein